MLTTYLPCERTFSKAGDVSEQRSRLSSQHVERLFLNSNSYLLEHASSLVQVPNLFKQWPLKNLMDIF
jgi:hypothetical protein